MVNIAGLDKAAVLQALHAAARPLGMGLLHARGPMTLDEARDMVAKSAASRRPGSIYFDYVHGCPLKVDIGGDEFDPRLYDRDQGQGAAEAAIDELRKAVAS